MKMQSKSVLFGVKSSAGSVDGNSDDFTTFYLPADFAASASTKAMGIVTVPYKLGTSKEFDKWAHLEKSFPASGIPVDCEFDVVAGKNAQGKDEAKLVLLSIKPTAAAARPV